MVAHWSLRCSPQVYPRASPGKSRGTASSSAAAGVGGVFMSISAETVKRSSKVLVAKRSLQVEVSFSEVRRLFRFFSSLFLPSLFLSSAPLAPILHYD